MLEAINISLSIGSKRLLNGISFKAKEGELLVIAGPNGAGKSTLLRAITAKTILDSGCVVMNGKDVYLLEPKELAKVRSVLSQSYATGLPFQVEEIVLMGRYPYFNEYANDEDYTIVKEVLNTLDICHLEGRVYATLSGGEQQRVQLARVLAQIWSVDKRQQSETKYLFLDEPISSLDLYHQQIVLQAAREMAQSGFCVIAVLHDLNLISQFADHVLLLNKGSIAAYGTSEEVFTEERIKEVYGLDIHLVEDPVTGQLLIIPNSNSTKNYKTINKKSHVNNNSIIINRTLESI